MSWISYIIILIVHQIIFIGIEQFIRCIFSYTIYKADLRFVEFSRILYCQSNSWSRKRDGEPKGLKEIISGERDVGQDEGCGVGKLVTSCHAAVAYLAICLLDTAIHRRDSPIFAKMRGVRLRGSRLSISHAERTGCFRF